MTRSLNFCCLQQIEQQADEALRVGRFLGVIGIDLGFDVETHVLVAGFAHEVEDLDQGRDRRARHRMLVRKLRRIGAARPDLADIVFFDLVERQLDKGNAGRRDIGAVGPAGEVGVELAFVRDDDRGVACDPDIQLQRVHAHRQRVGKGLQRVFGKQRPSAPVGFNIEGQILEGHRLSTDTE